MAEPLSKKPKIDILSITRHPHPTFPRHRLFEGLYAPTPTPYDNEGKLNIGAIPLMGKKLMDDGVTGVFVNGTMGESVLNSVEDRKAVAEAWLDFAGPKETRTFKVIVHIGTENGLASKEMAAHAEEAGADAVACMSPCIFKPKTVNALVDYLAEVAAGCPKTPFLYYHCTFLTGPTFRCIDVLKALDLAIPNMKGCKMTDTDFGDLALCLQYFPDMDLFPGYDNQFLPCAIFGASAFINGGFNLIAPMYLKCWLFVKEGNLKEAAAVFARILDFWERMDTHRAGVYGRLCHSIKYILGKKCDVNLGLPRPPVAQLTEQDIDAVCATLKEWGWIDWAITPSE